MSSSPAQLLAWSGRVTAIEDGDGLWIEGIHVRLYGVDAPEDEQPGGAEATAWLESVTLGKRVVVHQMAVDKYRRPVGIVYTDDLCINAEAVRQGHAWVWDAFCRLAECRRWRDMQTRARETKAGLWTEDKPLEPWKWRRMQRTSN